MGPVSSRAASVSSLLLLYSGDFHRHVAVISVIWETRHVLMSETPLRSLFRFVNDHFQCDIMGMTGL